MAKAKTTKRALLMSVLSMLLCVSMLVGSTFAWFTDSVTSGKNQIVAGNLDIELKYQNASMTSFEEVTKATTDLFVSKEGKEIIWEPGAAAVTYLELKNAGNLALKYQLSVNAKDAVVGSDGAALSKVLKTAVVEIDKTEVGTYTRETAIAAAEAADAESVLTYNKPGTMTKQGDTLYLAMIVYFPKEIENTYDGALYNRKDVELETELSLNLVATQTPHEEDSFNSQYDADAKLEREISNIEALTSALQEGGNYKLTGDMAIDKTINIPADTEVTLNLNGHTLDASANTSRPIEMSDGTSLTINGGNETVKMGAYGLVNIPANVTKTTITLNGGNYVGKTDNGSMIKPRGFGEITVNLNNVTVKDESDNESWIINTSHYYSNKLTVNVNGGSYTGFNGFDSGGPLSLTDVTMNIKHVAVYNAESGYGTTIVDSCNITVTNEGTAGMNNNYPNACIAASGNATIVVKNSTLTNVTGNATSVYTSGGNIKLENCQIIGRHTHYHGSGEYPYATFSTTIDGETAEIVYPNCPNGCKTYNH